MNTENLTQEEVPTQCDHKRKLVHDWIGDQNVINGTQHFSYLECTVCGETDEDTSKHEPDYYEPEDDPDWRLY